ncbi:MAG TPA: LLM class flavin-dependent oxidoreductase [Methylomirabilota bacterium]|nr:LLM class flavin-dependent oxidoreductase [Methylomirabilota bacterium]
MDFHAFMYVTIGRRHELERGLAGKDPVLYQRMGQDPGLMAMFLGRHAPRLRIDQFGYVLPTHNPLRVAEHTATLDHLLDGRLNVAFVRGYQARWFENYAAVPGARHVSFNEMFLLFGQGILARDRCLKTLELFADKVIPRFR